MTKRSPAFKLSTMPLTSSHTAQSTERPSSPEAVLIGVDVGGTKVEVCALHHPSSKDLSSLGQFLYRERLPTPQGDYPATIELIHTLVEQCCQTLQIQWPQCVGLGIPGTLDPQTQTIRGSNSLVLNGQAMAQDLRNRLACDVVLQNDANCFALSEAMDGAGHGHAMVFGVIIGTGCGGGIVHHQQIWGGANQLGGEWGHTPLPWANELERQRAPCWCKKPLCMERFVSGTGFEEDHLLASGLPLKAPAIVELARGGNPQARASLERYIDRLARGLSMVVNILDPDCIVLGGGMSLVEELYSPLEAKLSSYCFHEGSRTPILKAVHGDSSGVRGAAWLSQPPAKRPG